MSFEDSDESKGDAATAAPQAIRIRNLMATANWLSDYLWHRLPALTADPRARLGAADRIHRAVEQSRAVCKGAGGEPAALVEPSRSTFAWLAYLDAGNLDDHLAALSRAREALPPDLKVRGLPVLLHIRTMSALWKFRRYSNCLHISCSEGFITGDTEFWRAFFDAISLDARDEALRLARGLSASEEFNTVALEIEAQVEPTDPNYGSAGEVHDLSASFERVNRMMFGGTMLRPALAWTRSATARTLGLYMFSRDRLVVSKSLDHPDVPELLVDYIMYHELLHKKLGLRRRHGRNQAHTAQFRAEERRFPRYNDAQAEVAALVKRMSSRQG